MQGSWKKAAPHGNANNSHTMSKRFRDLLDHRFDNKGELFRTGASEHLETSRLEVEFNGQASQIRRGK